MSEKKDENVDCVFKDGKAYLTGDKVKAVLEISNAELKNMYFGGKGVGKLSVKIEE
jgi:hypothetical protein